MSGRPRVVVVGGGITGLTAAHRLAATCDVILVEGAEELGGKIRSATVGGATVDVGAEAFLVRRPEAIDLVAELGLSIEHPVTADAAVLSDGRLYSLPSGTVMGIPRDLRALRRSGLVGWGGWVRAGLERWQPGRRLVGDVALGALVDRRMGPKVLDRLVEPLLGGVYAASATGLSLEMAVPALAAAMRKHHSLYGALRELPTPQGDTPVFGRPAGGIFTLIEALRRSLDGTGVEIATGVPVSQIRARSGGYVLTVGKRELAADAIVLACPAAPARKLLTDVAPAAADRLLGVDYANVAIVTFASTAESIPHLGRSGYLVALDSGGIVKGVTMTAEKWGSRHPSIRTLRASVGRLEDSAALALTDEAVIARVWAELRTVLTCEAEPVEAVVTRWGGGLPQYTPGHLQRVAALRSALAPKIVMAGAALDGVGIPACIASATTAVEGLLRELAHERDH